MNISDLRERIMLQTRKQVGDDLGGYTENWTDTTTVWAYVKPKPPNYQVIVRCGVKLDTTMRIKWRGQLFTIATNPTTDPSRRWIEFSICEIRD